MEASAVVMTLSQPLLAEGPKNRAKLVLAGQASRLANPYFIKGLEPSNSMSARVLSTHASENRHYIGDEG